eukprot:3349543-Pyramimonas_sp.AAC.1
MKASNRDTSNPPRAANKECTTGPSWWGSPANTTAHVGFRVASERGMRLSGMVACITGIATRLPLTILRVPPTPSLINSSGQLKHSTVQSVQCSATVQLNKGRRVVHRYSDPPKASRFPSNGIPRRCFVLSKRSTS